MLSRLRGRLARRARRNIALYPLLLSLGAAVLAALTLWVDARLAPGPFPPLLRFPAPNARMLVSGLVGAIVTVAVFAFWMRAMMVQLVSSQFSPRILGVYLEDNYQRFVMGLNIGALVYVVVVLGALPPGDDGAVPMISLVVATLMAIAAVLSILVAMRDSTESLGISEVIRRITDDLLDRIAHAAEVAQVPQPSVDASGGGRALRIDRLGWVQEVRRHDLARALGPDGVVRLEVRAGGFVAPGDRVATLVSGDIDERAFRDAFTIGRVRTRARDIEFGFQQLVDVAEAALAAGNADASTAYEVVVHVEAAMRRLMEVGVHTGHATVEGGGAVVAAAELDEAGLLRATFERMAEDGGRSPMVARHLIRTLGRIREAARSHDRSAAALAAEEQAATLLRRAANAGVLEEDLVELQQVARSMGFDVAEDDGDRTVDFPAREDGQ